MASEGMLYIIILIATAVITAASALYTWWRRPVPGNRTVMLTALAGGGWLVGYALEIASASVPTKIFWNQIQYVGVVTVTATWLVFTLQYTGREKWVTPHTLALLSIEPIITLLLVFTNEAHGLIWGSATLETEGPFLILVRPHGVGFWIHAAYTYALLFAAAFLLVQMLIHSRHLYRRQAWLLLFATFLPLLGSALMVFDLNPFLYLDLTPLSFIISVLLLTWGLYRLRVGDILPVARDAVIESMYDGVIVLDGQNRIVDMNAAAQQLVGHATSKAIGQSIEQIRPDWPDLIGRPSGGNGTGEEVVLSKGGEQLTYDVRVSPIIDWLGHVTSQVIVLRDVTERKLATEALRESEERAQQHSRLAAVGQLAAGIAHDFNNIVATIIMYAQLLSGTPDLPTKSRERLAVITHQAKRASKLIEQILDFGRRSMLERQPLNLRPLMEELVGLLERTLPESIQVTLKHGWDEYIVNADPARIQQVMMNLAINARDAMEAGGALQIGLKRLHVLTGETPPLPEMGPGQWVQVTVADTGTGILPEVMPHIYDPFFTTKEPGQGSGLGLAQVYGIITQHKGYIDVESAPGEGTIFSFYLPALPVPRVEPLTVELAEPVSGYGETILVVEDDPSARAALKDTLEVLNYQVLVAMNGREAMEVFERHAEEVALVISDLVMPRMGGRELVRELTKMDPHLKALAITGYELVEDMQELRDDGIQQVVQKPFELRVLAKTIRLVLDDDRE